jgi:uncharacterized protein (TIGR03437 family)
VLSMQFVGKLTALVTPAITGISPSSAPVGSSVTIAGVNFGETQGATSTVTFNGLAAPVTSWNTSSINVLVPAGVKTGSTNVSVAVSGVATNTWNFNVLPNLLSLSVQPSIPGMIVGRTQQFTVTGTYSDGTIQDLTSLVN